MFSKSIVTIIETIQFFPKDKTCIGFSRVKSPQHLQAQSITVTTFAGNVNPLISNTDHRLSIKVGIQ